MSKGCILQVEDEPNDVDLLQRAFTHLGVSNPVQVVTDGQMAIDYLAGNGRFADRLKFPLPSLVLLDLKLPHKSGREVLEWIRAHPAFRRLVVIVFTSGQYVGDIGLAYDLGANAFLIKPPDYERYLGIARLLKDWLYFNQFAPLPEASWIPPLPAGEAAHLWGNQPFSQAP